jgi:hypothetical protein
MKRSNLKGQAVLEYAGLIGLTVLALFALSMQGYLKKSIASRMQSDVTRTFGEEQYYGTNTNRQLYLILNETWSVTGNNIP